MRLELVTPDDIPVMYAMCCQGQSSLYWRYRGTTPAPAEFAATFWNGVVSQFKVRDLATGSVIGLTVLYEDGGHFGKVGAIFDDSYLGLGVAAEAVCVFIDFVFSTRPYLKVYFETSSDWFPMTSVGVLRHEGSLAHYVHQMGSLATLEIFSLYRQDWDLWKLARKEAIPASGSLNTVEDFRAEMARRLNRQQAELDVDVPLYELGLDSLEMVTLLVLLDEMVPDWEPPGSWSEVLRRSLRDILHLACAEYARRAW